MKFCLRKEEELLRAPLTLILEEKGHTYGEGGIVITPSFVREDMLRLEKNGAEVSVQCPEKAHFFRGIGYLLEHLSEENFRKEESVCLDALGAMPDCSRNGVVSVPMLKKSIRTMALLGMNELFLYMEDTYEIPEYPYFGAYRGRYTQEELRECDAYAEMFGIALIPCIQTLAHLRTFLAWPASAALRDTADTLLPGDERVYELIDAMLRSLSASVRSRKIHLGMDEAHNLGLGEYLRKHGFTDRLAIMKNHLERVSALCRKYGLEPMMWSDMYFNLLSADGGYYSIDENADWPEDKKPGKDMTMVYWDYYNHDPKTYEKMFKLNRRLSDKVYFAGGGWTWNGVAPDYGKALDSTRVAMEVLKQQGIRCAFMTFWMDDGTETPFTAGLLPLILFAEEGFSGNVTEHDLDEKLRWFQKSSFADWMLLNRFDCLPGTDEKNVDALNPSKQLLYQDPLIGMFDRQYQGYDLYGHYGNLAKELREVEEKAGEEKTLFACFRALAECLAVKGGIGMDIRRAYLADDRDWLKSIAEEQIEVCLEELEQYHEYREKLWFAECKPNGYEVLDIRLGGLKARLSSAKKRILSYLDGEIDAIPELLEERIPFEGDLHAKTQPAIRYNGWYQTVTAGNTGTGTI